MANLSDLKQRSDALLASLHYVEGRRADLISARNSLQARITDLQGEIKLLNQVEGALGEISQRVVGQSVDPIDALVTRGLKVVFDDQDLRFSTVVEKARGKTTVRFVLMQNGEEAPILESYGGGVVVVAGVLIRIVTIMTLGARRILCLDETLAHVSRKYIPALSALLKELCDSLGFTIIMVTHTEEFAEFAHVHYRAVDGGAAGTKFESQHSHQSRRAQCQTPTNTQPD